MAVVGEFGAAKREAATDREPDEIIFYGEKFQLADEVGVMPLLEFAHAADAGLEASEMHGLAAMYDLIHDCLADEDEWNRFRHLAKRVKADAEVLFAVCQRVYEVISGRPTEQPSDSSDGRLSTGTSPSSNESSARLAALGMEPVAALGTG